MYQGAIGHDPLGRGKFLGFVNRSPRSKRLEGERQALLDAIRQAQLILSVKRLSTWSKEPAQERNASGER